MLIQPINFTPSFRDLKKGNFNFSISSLMCQALPICQISAFSRSTLKFWWVSQSVTKKPILASSNLDNISNINMIFRTLVKLRDYWGEKIQPCTGFQCEFTEASKWLELLPVKGSLIARSNRTWLGHCCAPIFAFLEIF